MKLSFLVPIKATSSLNSRMHWAQRAKRVRQERDATALGYRSHTRGSGDWLIKHYTEPVVVTLTRIGPRRMDDDNVQGCLKAVRDEVAAQLGLDDGDARLTWGYTQEKGPYGVRVTIETREAEAA